MSPQEAVVRLSDTCMVFSEKEKVALIVVAGGQLRNPRGWIPFHSFQRSAADKLFRPSGMSWWVTCVGLWASIAGVKIPPFVVVTEPAALIVRMMAGTCSASFGFHPSGGVMDPVIVSCVPDWCNSQAQ